MVNRTHIRGKSIENATNRRGVEERVRGVQNRLEDFGMVIPRGANDGESPSDAAAGEEEHRSKQQRQHYVDVKRVEVTVPGVDSIGIVPALCPIADL